MADFIFIRHAESTNNHLAATGYPKKEDRPKFLKVRKPNPELTEDGRAQTALVARRIVEEYYSPAATVSSDSGVKEHGANGVEAFSTTSFTPRPVAEIWTSYLTRAIETAVAIQTAIKEHIDKVTFEDNGGKEGLFVPPIRLDSDATEVGGHYEYDATLDRQVGTPGFTNEDVKTRWPHALFTFPQAENATEGWNKSKIQETHEMAVLRANRFVDKMERVASEAAAAASSLRNADETNQHPQHRNNGREVLSPPLFIVITHGDFFRTFVHAVVTKADAEVCVGDEASSTENVVTTCRAPKRHVCDATIRDRARVKQNVGNTSLSHFGIRFSSSSSFSEEEDGASPPPNCSSSLPSETFINHRDVDTVFWHSAFMADNEHVTRDASQAAAVARFESKGKSDFEDTETK